MNNYYRISLRVKEARQYQERVAGSGSRGNLSSVERGGAINCAGQVIFKVLAILSLW
jgi:predicted outer membrane repeat protein